MLNHLTLPLDSQEAYAALLDRIGDARFVLIGEASHGTHEFYAERARLTRLLIEQRGFTAVAAEADWPDAYRVNRFVQGDSSDQTARQALGDFERFPRWMWRNTEVEAFVSWLREHNAARKGPGVGFYGLDLYSMHRSMNAVVDYLAERDPQAAQRARERYGCFELFGENPQAYGYATEYGDWDSCEQQAVEQLLELQQAANALGQPLADDEHFFAEQNARLALNAENYYRSVYRGREESWNVRDTHMAETLAALAEHMQQRGQTAKVVVWAHNSHLGDARASEMGWRRRELNLGQLTRERWPEQTFVVGQTTYAGEVFAADDWDEPGQVKAVRPGLSGSLEERLHEAAQASGQAQFWLDLRDPAVAEALKTEQLQRFIGVIYRPETERWSHYSFTRPAQQYDALLHLDQTSALRPLDPLPGEHTGDLPATFPSGE